MDAANVYAVMNIISFICTIPFVVVTELPTLQEEMGRCCRRTVSASCHEHSLIVP
jgi:hypothetical protein